MLRPPTTPTARRDGARRRRARRAVWMAVALRAFAVLAVGVLSVAVVRAQVPAADVSEFKLDGTQSAAVSGARVAATALAAVQLWGRQDLTWVQNGSLSLEPAVPDNAFGSAVALDGDVALVGAPQDEGRGAVYFFRSTGSTWSKPFKPTVSGLESGDQFGGAVAVSGNAAVVGAPGRNERGREAGAAYIFVREGAAWSQQAKITAADGNAADRFGDAVAIAGDTVVVGASHNDEKGADAGAVYVFQRTGTTWAQAAKLTGTGAGDNFGGSLAVSGKTIVIGAQHDSSAAPDAGAVFVFDSDGTQWIPRGRLTAPDAAAGDAFGAAVALDGDTLLVGAPLDDDKGSRSGSAYVFQRRGQWSSAQKITASDGSAGAAFGAKLALKGDTAVVSAPLAASARSGVGAVYVLTLRGPTPVFTATVVPQTVTPQTATLTPTRAAVSLSTATATLRKASLTATPTSRRTTPTAAPTSRKTTPPEPTHTSPATRTPTVAHKAEVAPRTAQGPCGNGSLDPGEQCDPGADDPNDCCTKDCRFVGDGAGCDDHNPATDNDMCLAGRCGSDVVPVVRVEARYPERAMAAGVEGSVRLQFTVTAEGTVEDIKVLSADPPRYFEAAAEAAVAQYKYKPRLENGVAVKRPGAQVVVSFKLR